MDLFWKYVVAVVGALFLLAAFALVYAGIVWIVKHVWSA